MNQIADFEKNHACLPVATLYPNFVKAEIM